MIIRSKNIKYPDKSTLTYFFQIQLLLGMKEGMKLVREAAKCRQVMPSDPKMMMMVIPSVNIDAAIFFCFSSSHGLTRLIR